jgi:hypothetical protein
MASKIVLFAVMLGIFAMISSSAQSFAIDEEMKATDRIKNNPVLMDMLKKIELSKKILAQMKEQKTQQDQKSIHIQEMRKKAQAELAEQVIRMDKDNEPFTPQNAFARFVSKKPAELHSTYWSMFDYQQEKIKAGKNARDQILANGGTVQDAWDAYRKLSATQRIKMIELNKEFSIKYGNADINVQNTFDSKGKLPRTD